MMQYYLVIMPRVKAPRSVLAMGLNRSDDRAAVIALHLAGNAPTEILKSLKKIRITRMFIYCTIKRFTETGTVQDRPRCGRPCTVRTPEAIKAVQARIRRNPLRKQKIMV